MFLATDANPDALQETAARAGRKPARGGASNLVCIAEPLETLISGTAEAQVPELHGIADRLTAILPWSGLLRALVLPGPEALAGMRQLCAPGARVEIVFSYDENRDAGVHGPLGEAGISTAHVCETLPVMYGNAGLRVVAVERIGGAELQAYDTTWAKRLAFGRPRDVWRLRAVR